MCAAGKASRRTWAKESTMTVSPSAHDISEHFAHCVQIFGGTTACSRRLGIDERAIRRFMNGERPISARLLQDTAQALRTLITEAKAAEAYIAGAAGEQSSGS